MVTIEAENWFYKEAKMRSALLRLKIGFTKRLRSGYYEAENWFYKETKKWLLLKLRIGFTKRLK